MKKQIAIITSLIVLFCPIKIFAKEKVFSCKMLATYWRPDYSWFSLEMVCDAKGDKIFAFSQNRKIYEQYKSLPDKTKFKFAIDILDNVKFEDFRDETSAIKLTDGQSLKFISISN